MDKDEYNEILTENAKLKAELAELKKGEVETECWYLVEDKDGDEWARWLNNSRFWNEYIGCSNQVRFDYFIIKERLYKASEVEG